MTAPAPRSPALALTGLLAVTPPGWAFPTDSGSNWAKFLTPWANEISLIETTTASMINEIDPRTAAYTLPDYERVLGPDPYGRDATSLDLTTTEQAQLAWSRWTDTGGLSANDFIALAASMGVTITITTCWQTQCGQMQCGGPGLCPPPKQYAWLVTMPGTEPQAGMVTAAITAEAPSWTQPFFAYT